MTNLQLSTAVLHISTSTMANTIVNALVGLSSLGNGKKGSKFGSRTHQSFSCVSTSELCQILGNGKKEPNLGRHTHQSTEKVLSLGRHAVPDIVRLIAEWTQRRGSQLSARQQAALLRYRRDRVFSISNDEKYPEREFMKAYYGFFDDIFFGGCLSGRCKIKAVQTPVFSVNAETDAVPVAIPIVALEVMQIHIHLLQSEFVNQTTFLAAKSAASTS